MTMSSENKTKVTAKIIRERVGSDLHRILVVGCGSGIEAAILAQELKAKVFGIDINPSFDPIAAKKADLREGDATSLEFVDEYFDFVYSYHVLEHIPNFRKALFEIRRVLIKGGAYFIGTPNRLRLFSYILIKTTPLSKKIKWNLSDWKSRIKGKFRNEYGAHAGFSSHELQVELKNVFNSAEEVTVPYYLESYPRYAHLIRFLDKSGLGKFLFPSVYFFGRK